MKKIILIVAIAMVSLSASAQTKLKLGWINSSELLDVMPDKKKAAAKMDSMTKVEESIIKILNDDYEKKAKDIQANGSKMTPDNYKRATEELGKIEEGIYMQTENARTRLQDAEKTMINPILDKIAAAIKDVGKDLGYNYIFDISLGSVLVYPPDDDVLKPVKKKLGLPVID